MTDKDKIERLEKENSQLRRALIAMKANAIYFADEALYPKEIQPNKSDIDNG